MSENLLALSAPKPMTATELGNFLSKNIYPLTSIHTKSKKNYLDSMINKLQLMKEESQISEQRAYDMLGVKSLEELQQELDKLNASGLFTLTNEALKKMPAIKKTKGQYVKIDDIRETIEKSFNEFILSKGYKNITEMGYEIGERGIREIFHQFERENLGIKKGSLLSDFRTGKATSRGEKILGLFFNEIKKDRKKNLASILNLKTLETIENDTEEITSLTITINEETALNYYPYFSLSAEEKKLAEENDELWEQFVESVSSCTRSLKKETAWVMNNLMKRDEFISTGGSYADIVGVLGELQTLVFLYSLGGKMDNIPSFLGHAVNNKTQKVGVDVALRGIGFQVKNYSMYGSRETQDQGIQLSGDYTLKNFLDLIEPNFLTPEMRWNLEQFYAASAYHIAMHSDFNNIRAWMDNMQRTYLPRMYHGAIAELLPLKEITWIDKDTRSLGKATNAFYIIGGERILPVSKILNLYIKYLNDFKQNIDNPKLIIMKGNNGGVKYTKDETYADYYNNQGGYVFSGYSSISDNIYIRYNINMNIDYSIDEVLSRALKV